MAAAVDVQHVYFSGGKTNSSFSTGREDMRVYLKWEIRVFDENSPRGIRANAEQKCSSHYNSISPSGCCMFGALVEHSPNCLRLKNVPKTTTIIPACEQRTETCSLIIINDKVSTGFSFIQFYALFGSCFAFRHYFMN